MSATQGEPHMKHRSWLIAAAAGALLVPASAQAATKPVYIGPPPKGMIPGVAGPAYDAGVYPGRITIAAGDSLKVSSTGGPGDLTYLAKGDTVPSYTAPAGAAVTGAK